MTPVAGIATADGRINTRFGEFQVESPQIIEFPEGLPGFEGCQRFVLVLADELAPLSCLQSLDAPYPSFLASDPSHARAGYRPALSEADRRSLGVGAGEPVLWLVLLTLGLDQVTANLKAPVAVNPATMRGRQVILEAPDLPVAWPLDGP